MVGETAYSTDFARWPQNGNVVHGTTVEVLELGKDVEHTFIIVGSDEADIALVEAPSGQREMEVPDVCHE
jgi:transcription elongation GreA/GreB family factor